MTNIQKLREEEKGLCPTCLADGIVGKTCEAIWKDFKVFIGKYRIYQNKYKKGSIKWLRIGVVLDDFEREIKQLLMKRK